MKKPVTIVLVIQLPRWLSNDETPEQEIARIMAECGEQLEAVLRPPKSGKYQAPGPAVPAPQNGKLHRRPYRVPGQKSGRKWVITRPRH